MPASSPSGGAFTHHRLAAGAELPRRDPGIVDVAILDMNHGWPNVGHDAVVAAIQRAAAVLARPLADAALSIRAVSFDVRRELQLPEPADDRFAIYVGTGGPGHLDPRRNDGTVLEAQGVAENPAWEAPLFRLFDAIAGREDAALLAVCHTFGLMCRWLGVADPVARGPEKGGKSEGVLDNLLTPAAREHPLFSAFARRIGPEGRLRVLDSRLYDLIPNGRASERMTILAIEALGVNGPPGNAMTMMEVARDGGGTMPRILGVNHHPEIIDRHNLMARLRDKLDRGEISREWYDYRVLHFPDESHDGDLEATSDFTFTGPLRFHITRAARARAAELGHNLAAHESDIQRTLTA